MKYRVTDACAWQLPDGQLVRPGELVDSGAGGLTDEIIEALIVRGYLEPAEEPTARPPARPAPKAASMKPRDDEAPGT